MPTAAVAKLEKQASLDANDPLRLGIVFVEHKIRNLEKRKVKLDGYRDLQKSGKELNSDQLEAIFRYDIVIQQLEFAKELSKHLTTLALDAVKNLKKQARKDAQEKAQQDLLRTKDMLMIQEVLSNMGQDTVRDDLLSGKAKVTLTPEELRQIDDLYIELAPKREEHFIFQELLDGPAEVMSNLLDGKNKEACGTTYSALKSKLLEIGKSGYFDSPQPQPEAVVEEVVEPLVAQEEPIMTTANVNVPIEQASQVTTCTFQPSVVNQMAPGVTGPPQPVPVAAVPPVVAQPEEMRNPSAIETTYFAPSHLRAFQSATIDFMQENEVETLEHAGVMPPLSSIPTMTYTNQSFTPMEPVQCQEPVPQQPVVSAQPVQPDSQQIYQNQTDEEKGWSHVGSEVIHQQPQHNEETDWGENEAPVEDSWASQAEQQWTPEAPQALPNDGFIMQGGRGRGGRGRGGGDRSQKGGVYNPRGGNRPSRGAGGYNNREGGYNNRDGTGGGYSNREREGGGGYYKDQNSSYQNGYHTRSERGGRGRGGQSNDRRGRGGGGGPRSGGGYRGGSGGGYRQQQQ